jgi:sialic acid synthase SpsE/mRNA-degrading endonuclease toxin of MazEF toxin-antitoxin module
VKIIAEIGINFNSKLELVKKLIDIASNSGCDFAKFQLFKANGMYPKSAGTLDWKDETKEYSYDIYEAVKKFELPYEWLDELIEYCEYKNIEFLASIFSFEDLEIYKKLNLKYIKLASYSITNLPLIEEVAKSGMYIFLSTGGSYLSEVDEAVRMIRKYHNNFTLMHCSIAYPTKLNEVNMGILDTFKNAFECEIGYSDHTAEIYEAPLQAKLLGASVVEKHITFDKNANGPDHFFALDEKELKIMVDKLKNEKNIKLDKNIYGSTKRIPYPQEEYLRNFAYHQLFINKDIKLGELITQNDISILRRAKKEKGLEPKYWYLFKNGIVASKDLKNEDVLKWDNVLVKNNVFRKWNFLKEEVDKKNRKIFIKDGNIYLTIIGRNIGSESYGKGIYFLRPVLVLKKLSNYSFVGIPLTSKEKSGSYYFKFRYKNDKYSYAMFNQIRVFDTKRVFKYHGKINDKVFEILKDSLNKFLISSPKGDVGAIEGKI